MTLHCFTSASFSYLDRARVLAGTLRRFHPDWVLWLCLTDREPPGFVWSGAPAFDHVVRAEELPVPGVRGWLFQHEVVEACTAVKGAMARHLLATGAERVVYLDPDIALFAPLDPLVQLLDQHPILLTPHLLQAEADAPGQHDNELSTLKHGVFNLGFLALNGSAEARRFAAWWDARLQLHCFDAIPDGLFTDQRWCDLAPVLFPGLHIVRDPGCNVASWNLRQRPVRIDQAGDITAGGAILRFFHFTKLVGIGLRQLELNAGESFEVFELARWYLRRLEAERIAGLPDDWWAYGRYDDGTPIERAQRRLYRERADLQRRFPDPFASGDDSYLAWLRQEAAV